MKLQRKILACSILFTQLFYCNTKQPNRTNPYKNKPVQFDSNAVLKLVPIDTAEKNSLGKVAKILGIDDIRIKKEQPGVEIRIWFGYALSDSAKLVVLKNDGNSWQSSAYFYKYIGDKNANVISIEKKVEKKEPQTSWPIFLERITSLGIYQLKNYDEIKDYAICSDGDTIVFEIWRNNLYSFYEYPCYEVYVEEIKLEDVIKVKEICLLIQKQFGYRLFPRPKS